MSKVDPARASALSGAIISTPISDPNPSSTFNFLGSPPELRLCVYELLLVSESQPLPVDLSTKRPWRRLVARLTSSLAARRLMSREGRAVFYAKNILRFHDSGVGSMELQITHGLYCIATRPHNIAQIQRAICIHLCPSMARQRDYDIPKFAETLNSITGIRTRLLEIETDPGAYTAGEPLVLLTDVLNGIKGVEKNNCSRIRRRR